MKKIDKQNLLWIVVLINLLLTVVSLGLIVTYILNPRTSNDMVLDYYDKYTKEIQVYMDQSNADVLKQVNERVGANEEYTDKKFDALYKTLGL